MVLFFSVNESRAFQGYARMASRTGVGSPATLIPWDRSVPAHGHGTPLTVAPHTTRVCVSGDANDAAAEGRDLWTSPDGSATSWGSVFKVKWQTIYDLPFDQVWPLHELSMTFP